MRAHFSTTKLWVTVTLIFAAFFVPEHAANAGVVSYAADQVAQHTLYPLLANLGYVFLMGATIFLRMTAMFLNSAIWASLHISDLITNLPAINVIWKTIRDFSSIFLIFMLLYASITMILDIEGPKFKQLVINIVIAGLLINFSLFFTKVAIDASNVVAASFYRAIDASADTSAWTWGNPIPAFVSSTGIANAFMGGLRIQTIFDSTAGIKHILNVGGISAFPVDLKIVIATFMGTAIMFGAGLSFLAAGIMFVGRLAILLLLISFSPIYFIGMILPQVKPYAKEWLNMLINQCLFAPIYLMIMYVILRIITDPGFAPFLGGGKDTTILGDIFSGETIGVIMMYALIIVMINGGLAASSKFAGKAGEFGMAVHKWTKSKIANKTYGAAGRWTLGQAGAFLDKKAEGTDIGNSRFGRELRSYTTGALAKAKFGGTDSFSDEKKLTKEIKAKQREIDAARKLKASTTEKEARDILRGMSTAEINNIDMDVLKKSHVVQHLSQSQVKAFLNNSEKSEADKVALRAARAEALKADPVATANMMKNLSGEDLMEMIESGEIDPAVDTAFIDHLKPSQLKQMDKLSEANRRTIGAAIIGWGNNHNNRNHPALNHVTQGQAADVWNP